MDSHSLSLSSDRKGLLVSSKLELWSLLEAFSSVSLEYADITTSITEVASIKTSAGKARAWLRMALLKKQLSDVFHALIEQKELISQFYESTAFMRCDESIIPAGGLFIGLNIIDFKGFDIREVNLDDFPFRH